MFVQFDVTVNSIDELRDVRHQSQFLRIDAALGEHMYNICPPSTASMRTKTVADAPHLAACLYSVSERQERSSKFVTYLLLVYL